MVSTMISPAPVGHRQAAPQGGERPMGMFKRFLSIFITVYAL